MNLSHKEDMKTLQDILSDHSCKATGTRHNYEGSWIIEAVREFISQGFEIKPEHPFQNIIDNATDLDPEIKRAVERGFWGMLGSEISVPEPVEREEKSEGYICVPTYLSEKNAILSRAITWLSEEESPRAKEIIEGLKSLLESEPGDLKEESNSFESALQLITNRGFVVLTKAELKIQEVKAKSGMPSVRNLQSSTLKRGKGKVT